MTCTLCGGDHRGWETAICRKNRAMPVVDVGSSLDHLVVHAPSVGSSRHGKYADIEKRKAYRRVWMAAKRAK